MYRFCTACGYRHARRVIAPRRIGAPVWATIASQRQKHTSASSQHQGRTSNFHLSACDQSVSKRCCHSMPDSYTHLRALALSRWNGTMPRALFSRTSAHDALLEQGDSSACADSQVSLIGPFLSESESRGKVSSSSIPISMRNAKDVAHELKARVVSKGMSFAAQLLRRPPKSVSSSSSLTHTHASESTAGAEGAHSNQTTHARNSQRVSCSSSRGARASELGVCWDVCERMDFLVLYSIPSAWGLQEQVRNNSVAIQCSPVMHAPNDTTHNRDCTDLAATRSIANDTAMSNEVPRGSSAVHTNFEASDKTQGAQRATYASHTRAYSVHGFSLNCFAYTQKVSQPDCARLLHTFLKRFNASVNNSLHIVATGSPCASAIRTQKSAEVVANGVGGSQAAAEQTCHDKNISNDNCADNSSSVVVDRNTDSQSTETVTYSTLYNRSDRERDCTTRTTQDTEEHAQHMKQQREASAPDSTLKQNVSAAARKSNSSSLRSHTTSSLPELSAEQCTEERVRQRSRFAHSSYKADAADLSLSEMLAMRLDCAVAEITFTPAPGQPLAHGLCRAFFNSNKRFHYVVVVAVPDEEYEASRDLIIYAITSVIESRVESAPRLT